MLIGRWSRSARRGIVHHNGDTSSAPMRLDRGITRRRRMPITATEAASTKTRDVDHLTPTTTAAIPTTTGTARAQFTTPSAAAAFRQTMTHKAVSTAAPNLMFEVAGNTSHDGLSTRTGVMERPAPVRQ